MKDVCMAGQRKSKLWEVVETNGSSWGMFAEKFPERFAYRTRFRGITTQVYAWTCLTMLIKGPSGKIGVKRKLLWACVEIQSSICRTVVEIEIVRMCAKFCSVNGVLITLFLSVVGAMLDAVDAITCKYDVKVSHDRWNRERHKMRENRLIESVGRFRCFFWCSPECILN